jgi:multiple sugar transport system substrate-binding protein
MRRVATALSIALVALAAGCGGGSSSDEPNTAGQAASTDKTPVTITLRHPWQGDEKKLFEESLAGFTKKYPWITVDTIGFGGDSSLFDQQIVIKTINAGNPPDAFLSFGPDYVGQYCANDLWQDLTPFMQGDKVSIDMFAPAAITYRTSTTSNARCRP